MAKVVMEKWPAPIRGWWQSGDITVAPKDAAEKLDNFFPTTQGVRLRGGTSEAWDAGASVKALMTYSSTTDTLLVAGANNVWTIGEGVPTFAQWDATTSGDWAYTQQSSAAGEYLVAVNGSDYAFVYDGTNFNPVAGEAINNLPYDALSSAFEAGDTVTGDTSGATATIYGITQTSATAGILKIGAVTGTFQDNEPITGAIRGSATTDIPGGVTVASTATITGVATNALSQVWLFKERLFFVEKDSQSVWYLPVESIGGAASEINLGSVFRRGGNVLFGANWSIDSGSGIDDVCVIVSENGEVAVYSGLDPDSAATWALSGVYEIGRPVNKRAFFKSGGDLAVLSDEGIVTISQAISRDRATLSGTAMTAPIERAWAQAVDDETAAHPISATVWAKKSMLFVGVATTEGSDNIVYVMNTNTGAWARYLGLDVRCAAVANDALYFGSDDGKVYLAETGGSDAGTSFTGLCVPKFTSSGANNKFLTRAMVTTRAGSTQPTFSVKGLTDYSIPAIAAPGATAGFDPAGALTVYHNWRKITGHGFAIAPAISITSDGAGGLSAQVELLSVDMAYEVGTPL